MGEIARVGLGEARPRSRSIALDAQEGELSALG